MKTRVIAAFICTLALASTSVSVLAGGQQQPAPRKREQNANVTWERAVVVSPDAGPVVHGHMGGDQFVFLSSEMSVDGRIVKDSPYSAVAVTESIQTLTDGNRIVHKNSSSIYRDSAGRTRREQSLSRIGPYSSAGDTPNTILINDPVGEVNYILEPQSRIARKMNLPRKKVDVRLSPEDAAKLRGVHVASGPITEEHHKIAQEKMAQISVNQPGGGGGLVIARSENGKPRIAPQKESLGKQVIEGVEAEGTRMTITIPAGDIGNEMPIQIISEQWYSPEMHLVIMSRHSDPRTGERTYRLTNISRTEPASSLFEVPSDYTIRENASQERVNVELLQKKLREKANEQQ
jgi:hypothetical protein